ncbi:MAG: type I-E CRISPR-associated protein Cse2/CasB [candidate division Zixibacteria bacterium]|nr:type I-E CRISPR-associated protein Cse2/CasB [candidate division Zixibacteria bacterium]
MNSDQRSGLITYLKELAKKEDRGALAQLRRGLGKPPGLSIEMMPYVTPFIPRDARPSHARAAFTVAALFAIYPESTDIGNIGDHMKRLFKASGERDSIELRFRAMLNAPFDSLPHHLRQAVNLLRSYGIAVNWDDLYSDIINWSHPEKFVQRRWANSFWNDNTRNTDENINDQSKGE